MTVKDISCAGDEWLYWCRCTMLNVVGLQEATGSVSEFQMRCSSWALNHVSCRPFGFKTMQRAWSRRLKWVWVQLGYTLHKMAIWLFWIWTVMTRPLDFWVPYICQAKPPLFSSAWPRGLLLIGFVDPAEAATVVSWRGCVQERIPPNHWRHWSHWNHWRLAVYLVLQSAHDSIPHCTLC